MEYGALVMACALLGGILATLRTVVFLQREQLKEMRRVK